jgi:hypothetical protein
VNIDIRRSRELTDVMWLLKGAEIKFADPVTAGDGEVIIKLECPFCPATAANPLQAQVLLQEAQDESADPRIEALYYCPTCLPRHWESIVESLKTREAERAIERGREPAHAPDEGFAPRISIGKFNLGTDDGGNLLGRRYLCRGNSLLCYGPTGIGKSAFNFQWMVHCALGLDFFGLRPVGPLKCLLVQAENDSGDMAEMRDGIFRGMNLSAEQRSIAEANITAVNDDSSTGEKFLGLLNFHLAADTPDMIWIDPLFAYCGCNVSDQEKMSGFLRAGLNPILHRKNVGCVMVHHTNKPAREKSQWAASDYSYLASGSNELANWPKAVIGIQNVGSHSVYSVQLAKRGSRAGLRDEWRNPVTQFYIKHATACIHWEAASEEDLQESLRAKAGRAISLPEEVLALAPVGEMISKERLIRTASLELKAGIHKIRNAINELTEEGRLETVQVPRSGMRPAIHLRRPAGGRAASAVSGRNGDRLERVESLFGEEKP